MAACLVDPPVASFEDADGSFEASAIDFEGGHGTVYVDELDHAPADGADVAGQECASEDDSGGVH